MLPALLKMCLYRGLVSLSFSPLIILALLLSTLSYAGDDTRPYILFGVFLWLGSFIGAFLMDYIGRKKLMIIGALICGNMAIGAGVVYNDVLNFLYSTKMGKLLILLFVMELFAGVFSSSSSAYLTEAFPLHLKTYYIALSYTVQMLVLIIITSCSYDENSLGAYFITFGVFYVVACLLGLWCMPETRKLTLREARRKFAPVLYSWNE
ncbi:D-xylose-proton symporter-like 1 [Rhagoletis pomonella]|uniref:D-xylose-proton symporter-like 1 n=1 Tax=Rhagoletis pomonella TaxID=28610 RepID=UPI00177F6EAE|nr:D-xylose-proton symporter-like 1 [Rhagoletis pomonella]